MTPRGAPLHAAPGGGACQAFGTRSVPTHMVLVCFLHGVLTLRSSLKTCKWVCVACVVLSFSLSLNEAEVDQHTREEGNARPKPGSPPGHSVPPETTLFRWPLADWRHDRVLRWARPEAEEDQLFGGRSEKRRDLASGMAVFFSASTVNGMFAIIVVRQVTPKKSTFSTEFFFEVIPIQVYKSFLL